MSNIKWYELNMTSNTAPAPYVASASSTWSASSYLVFNLFSNTNALEANSWLSASGVKSSWAQIDYGKKTTINIFKLISRNYSDSNVNSPKNFEILGSDDGLTFTLIKPFLNQVNWTLNEERVFFLDNEVSYRFYRINVLDINGGSYITLGKLVFGLFAHKRLALKNPQTNQHYSLAEKTLIPLPDTSSKNMILHGIEAGKEIKLDEAFDKIQYPVEGAVVKTMLKPLSIKFE